MLHCFSVILSIATVYCNVYLRAITLTIYAFCMGAPLVILATIVGLTKLKALVAERSRKLDAISGILLLLIGAYYLWVFIWLTKY